MKKLKKIIALTLLLTLTPQLYSCNSNNNSLDNNSSLVEENETHTLSFDTDGGNEIAPIVQEVGTSIKMPYDPIKEGYTFIGWDKKVPDTMPNSDMTFKAQWIEGTMKFSIERNGTAAITSYKGEAKELILPSVVYNEYKLVEIKAFTFRFCATLMSITIPNSVNLIENYVFSDSLDLQIYCEAETQPNGWDVNWNIGRANVYWNASGQITIDGLVYTYNKSNNTATVIGYIDDLPEQFVIPKTIIVDEKIYYVTSYDFSELENIKHKTIVDEAVKRIYVDKTLTNTQYNFSAETTVKVNDNQYQIPLEWATDLTDRITFKKADTMVYANVNLPEENEEPITGKITATAKYESATATREFEVTLMPTKKQNDTDEKTIVEIKNVAVGETVTVTGVVVNPRNNGNGFYIVDGTGAMYVYDNGGKAGVGTTIAWGTKVKLTAMRGENDGTYNKSSVQLVYNETAIITAMGKEAMPLTGAQDLTITQFKAWKTDGTEDYSGGFYKVRGYLAKYTPAGKNYTNYEVVDDAGNYIQFYATDSKV